MEEPAVEPMTVASTCADSGFLRVSLSGALTARTELRDEDLTCESMRRPDDRGVRLRLSTDIDGERLAIIIAMPELDAGETGAGFDSIVTITVDGSGRFFSTANLGACWTDVAGNEPLDGAGGAHVISGAVSCVGPLGEFNGDAYVDVQELVFSGIADWSKS